MVGESNTNAYTDCVIVVASLLEQSNCGGMTSRWLGNSESERVSAKGVYSAVSIC
jgi:hypothetical protein